MVVAVGLGEHVLLYLWVEVEGVWFSGRCTHTHSGPSAHTDRAGNKRKPPSSSQVACSLFMGMNVLLSGERKNNVEGVMSSLWILDFVGNLQKIHKY